MTKSRLYKISAWKDNGIKIVLTQGEGSSADNPAYNKVIQFQCYDSEGLLSIPENAEITLAIERPDKTTDLLSGSRVNESDISFDVKNTLTSLPGIVTGEIRITSTSSLVKFYGISFNIYSGISNDAAEISEEFDALTKALQKVSAVTAGGTVSTLDSVIEHGGTNPVASGIIFDYIENVKQNIEKYVTDVEVDNAVSADTLYRVYTSADGLTATGYHTVIAVPSTNQIAQYLLSQNGIILYRKCAATNGSQSGSWETWAKYAKQTDIPTNVSQLLNDAGYLTENNVYTKSEVDKRISNAKNYELKYTLAANAWQNQKQEMNIPYEITSNTRIDIVIDNLEELQNVWCGTELVIDYDEITGKTYAEYSTLDYLPDEIPPIDIKLTLTITEVNTIG